MCHLSPQMIDKVNSRRMRAIQLTTQYICQFNLGGVLVAHQRWFDGSRLNWQVDLEPRILSWPLDAIDHRNHCEYSVNLSPILALVSIYPMSMEH